jgi:Cft2 family RNA processing exonuclease
MGIGASCFQVQIGPYEIVLDCGTRTKGHDPLPALDEIKHPNLLVISHAHQDHIGAVPVFHRRWPDVRMICTLAPEKLLTSCYGILSNSSNKTKILQHFRRS